MFKKEKVEHFKVKREARAKYEKVLTQYIADKKSQHAKKDEKVVEVKKVPVPVPVKQVPVAAKKVEQSKKPVVQAKK